jgi:hypothetical protein
VPKEAFGTYGTNGTSPKNLPISPPLASPKAFAHRTAQALTVPGVSALAAAVFSATFCDIQGDICRDTGRDIF